MMNQPDNDYSENEIVPILVEDSSPSKHLIQGINISYMLQDGLMIKA